MKLVVIESPYGSADPAVVERNVRYARAAMADCVRRGESPYASHLLLTQPGVLRDGVPEERAIGIEAGYAVAEVMLDAGGHVAFYCNLGQTPGMFAARERWERQGRTMVDRVLPDNWDAGADRVGTVGVRPGGRVELVSTEPYVASAHPSLMLGERGRVVRVVHPGRVEGEPLTSYYIAEAFAHVLFDGHDPGDGPVGVPVSCLRPVDGGC